MFKESFLNFKKIITKTIIKNSGMFRKKSTGNVINRLQSVMSIDGISESTSDSETGSYQDQKYKEDYQDQENTRSNYDKEHKIRDQSARLNKNINSSTSTIDSGNPFIFGFSFQLLG